MASVSTNEFKGGLKFMMDNEPCSIIENEYVKPGKGQAFNRVKLRKLLSGKVLEKTFKSGDTVELADVVDVDLGYLYSDGEFFHFMNNETYEQFSLEGRLGLVQLVLLGVIAALLAIGMSWSHIRRRLSGQYDTDEIE